MEMKIGRYRDGRLKAYSQHEETTYFWKSNLTECLVFENEKLRLEVLLMTDWWNREYHEEFEQEWKLVKNIIKKKE